MSLPDDFRADPGRWPITRRQATARELVLYLESSPFEDGLREIVQMMATDTVPMVRREAAEILALLPDDFYEEMAGLLGADSNSYVKEAARRAVERRGKGTKKSNRLRKDVLNVQERFEDFTDEYGARATRRARRMANDLFETLVGATLHNLVGYLPAMRLSLETLQRHFDTGKPNPTQCKAKLDSMVKQVDFMKSFAADMRLFAKAKPKNRTSVRLAEVVAEAIGIVRDGLESADLLNIQPDIPVDLRAAVYEGLLVTSLTHLIRNAAEALLESSLIKKKHIIIHARARPKGGVVIKVTDNGPGIDTQTLDDLRMFVPGKTTKPRRGTGFGLPTVQRYAEAHGGGLEIESEPGKGSIFTLTLPGKGGDDE